MKKIAGMKKKWKWMLGITSLFLLVFVAVFAFKMRDKTYAADPETEKKMIVDGWGQEVNGNYEMKRREDVFSIKGIKVNNPYCVWESLDYDVLTMGFADNTSGKMETTGTTMRVFALKPSTTAGARIKVTVYDKAGDDKSEITHFDFSISVKVAINITNDISGTDGKIMVDFFENSKRPSIIMTCSGDPNNPTQLQFGDDAAKYPNLLNLTYGSALDSEVLWTVKGDNVISIVSNAAGKFLNAEGAGKAVLQVSAIYDGVKQSDEIEVYVRPAISYKGDYIEENANMTSISMNTLDVLGVTVTASGGTSSLNDKLVWAISKHDQASASADYVFVRDALGHVNDHYKDDAKLEWSSSDKGYKLTAKAGEYNIRFYLPDIYNMVYKYNEGDKKHELGDAPVSCKEVSLNVKVAANFGNKKVSVNVGGKYSLSDAFNISEESLSEFFNAPAFSSNYEPVSGSGIVVESSDYVGYDESNVWSLVAKNKLGTAEIRVTAKKDFGDIKKGQTAIIIFNVTESFSLNISSTSIREGQKLLLKGIVGSVEYGNPESVDTIYKWSSTDEEGQYIAVESSTGKFEDVSSSYVTIKGIKETKSGPVKISLTRTSTDGVTLTATCNITVDSSATEFNIKLEKDTMNVGEKQLIETDISGQADIVWTIGGPEQDMATIEKQNDNGQSPLARVFALKPGTVVVTALNTANNSYATAVIRIEQPLTSLDVGINGEKCLTYEAVLSTGYIFMEPIYEPKDSTDTEFEWTSSEPSYATVDETGKVTLLKEKTGIKITVWNKKHTVMGMCILDIVLKPVTSITPDVSELSMVVGDTYTVKTTVLPENASDKKLTWSSTKESVATVTGGKITAVGKGETTILCESESSGTKMVPSINVTVRNKLTSIAFESKNTYINVGGTKQMNVIFNPDNDVNKNVTFKSSDTSVFTVDAKGIITGVSVGTAILTCVSEDLGEGNVISCVVNVTSTATPATDFVLTPAEGIVYVGGTLQIEKVFTPVDATNQYVTWDSSDKSKADVSANGLVTGIAETGDSDITITAVYTDTPDNVPWVRTCKIKVQKAPIYATDFDVTPATQNIVVGEKFNVTPVFTPADTTNKNVDYQSLDEGVVTVDEKGVVTGVGAGDAVIQCQSEDGGFIATCAVHVDNAIEFSLSPATREIAVGKSFKLKKITNPANANKTAVWSTSNANIATVDSSGKVTAKRIGSCTITCTLTKYNQSAKCKVKVAKLNSTVSLEKKNIRIGVGQTYRLNKTVWSNNSSLPKVSWKSSNKRVVTVNSGGKLTGKRVGLATVTVTTNDAVHAKATCKVRVIQRVTGISLSSDYIVCYVGRSKKLNVKYRPANATIKKVKWTSGNSSIARVTASGKIRGIAEGDTYVTATATDGSNKKARCYVKVLDAVPATSIVVAQSDLTMKKGDSAKLSYRVLPDNTSDDLDFASDNKRVAKVNNKGKVTAVGTGNAVITILATSGVSSTVNVNVVALNKTTLNMRQYDTETLIVLGTSDTVTWYTSNARVATVENGKVVGKAQGTAYIYAYVNGCKLGCKVTITSVNS